MAAATNEIDRADTPSEKMLVLNSAISNIGLVVLVSQITNAARRPAHDARIAMLYSTAQPNGLVKPNTRSTRIAEERKDPSQSNSPKRALGPDCINSFSLRIRKGAKVHKIPRGMFRKNTDRQPKASTKTPPMAGPIINAVPTMVM